MDPYTGIRVEAAGGNPLKMVGQVEMGIAISGLDTVHPKLINVVICEDLGPEVLIGRKLMIDWRLSGRRYGDVASRREGCAGHASHAGLSL